MTCNFLSKLPSNSTQSPQMVEACAGDSANVWLNRELGVKDHAEVADDSRRSYTDGSDLEVSGQLVKVYEDLLLSNHMTSVFFLLS